MNVDAEGFGWKWDEFGYQIQPIATKVPYMVAIGNHEYGALSFKFQTLTLTRLSCPKISTELDGLW
jgi:hypothetical protein